MEFVVFSPCVMFLCAKNTSALWKKNITTEVQEGFKSVEYFVNSTFYTRKVGILYIKTDIS